MTPSSSAVILSHVSAISMLTLRLLASLFSDEISFVSRPDWQNSLYFSLQMYLQNVINNLEVVLALWYWDD